MADYIWSRCITKPISTGMFYIEAGVFCIKAGHEVTNRIHGQISELYNCLNPWCHCFNVMADNVFRCNGARNGVSFFL